MVNVAFALARAELIHSLTAHQGITTADGNVAGTTLIDANLIGRNDFITEKAVLIMSGPAAYEDKGAASFVPGTGVITLQGAGFSAQIKAGTIYRILNISSVEMDVATINTKIGTNVDAAGTTTLFAWMANLLAAFGKVTYTEASASGNSGGDGAWHDALDLDTRGMKSFSAVVINTDGANSLNWRLRARPSNYSAGADEEIPECPGSETLAPAEKGLAELIKSYSRLKIQVQDTVAMSAATYTIDYLINR